MHPAGIFPIGLVGCGTVGTGVVRILQDSADLLTAQTGCTITLPHVVVRDLTRPRDVDLSRSTVSTNLDALLADNTIRAVVHVVGGTAGPRNDIIRLLQSGKDVITANKALICAHATNCSALHKVLVAPSALKPPSLAVSRSSPPSARP